MMKDHLLIDGDELVGVKGQQEAVEWTFNAELLNTLSTVVHEEYSTWTSACGSIY